MHGCMTRPMSPRWVRYLSCLRSPDAPPSSMMHRLSLALTERHHPSSCRLLHLYLLVPLVAVALAVALVTLRL
eukprot:5867106-Pyramimonas_sp.AAC.1